MNGTKGGRFVGHYVALKSIRFQPGRHLVSMTSSYGIGIKTVNNMIARRDIYS